MDLQQKMFKLVEDWKLSNLTKGEFSNQHKVTYHSFNYWIKKYYRKNKIVKQEVDISENDVSFFSLPDSSQTFKKRSLEKPKSNVSKRCEIELGNGIKITIY